MKASVFVLAVLAAAPGVATSEPYASLQLGYSSGDFPLGSPYNGVIDDRSLMYGLDVGFGFGRKWAVEVGWHGYDGFDGRGTPCPPDTVCPAIVVDVPNNDQRIYKASIVRRVSFGAVDFFAKAGYYRAKIDANIDLPESDFNERGLLLGAGVRWYFREPWSVSIEASRHDDNVSQLSVGAGWGLRRGRDDVE